MEGKEIMSFMGFPSRRDMSEMFGFVTNEDKAKWEQERDANQKSGSSGTASEMASKSAGPALDLARKGVQAQMHGAQTEAQRGAQAKVVTRETFKEQSRNVDDSGYTPGF